jgi:hypothetical protein
MDYIVDYTKRYWLFAYNDYYPSGGLDDLESTHDTLREAIARAKEPSPPRELYPVDCDTVQLWDNRQFKFIDIDLNL